MSGDPAIPVRLLAAHWPIVVGLALLGTALLTTVRVGVRRTRHRRLWTGARLVTVLAPPRVDEDSAQALWGNLAGLLRPAWRRLLFGQPHLTFEYRITPVGATIRMWVPGPVPPGLVERAVAAAWPGATTRTAFVATPDPRTRPPRDQGVDGKPHRHDRRPVATGGVLRLARTTELPIGDTTPGDPVATLLAAAGELPAPPAGPADQQGNEPDEVVVQVLARPVPTRSGTGRRRTRTGVLDITVGAARWLMQELFAILAPGPITRTRSRASSATGAVPRPRVVDGDPRARLERSSGDRAAVAKARGAAFETLVRYAAITHVPLIGDRREDRRRVRQASRVVRGRAGSVAAVFASFTDHNFYRHRHLRRPARAVAARRLGRGDVLSIAELAAIATLPSGYAPGLARAGARSVAPPPGIPTRGPDIKPIGDATTAMPGGGGEERGRAVGVRVADARHHLHVIGATGSGKSTLLVQMILADIRHQRGVVVIDPKGDLITDVWQRLPPAIQARTVLIDPNRPEHPPSLNPLAAGASTTTEAGRALAVENLVAICRGVFSAYWGPRTDDLLRSACLTLINQPDTRSLADLPALLTDPDTRARHMRAIAADPVLRGFWTGYEHLSEPARAQIIAPLMNKVRALLLRPFTRAVLTGPPPNSATATTKRAVPVDMAGVLDGGILLARIPKGSFGDEGTRLIGSIIVAHTWAAATARAATPQHQRRDAGLVIDECHNFLHMPTGIDDLLAEARGLRLSLTLAHQNLAQLPRDLRAGISTNARNKIFFNVGPDDARDLARHTLPHLDEHDLAHLDAFHAAARLVHHDAETRAFTLRTRPLPAPETDRTATDNPRAARRSP